MQESTFDLIIVGAGPGGLSAAAHAGQLGMSHDLGVSSQHRGRIDGLYRLVRNDEGYTPESFVSALRELQGALDSSWLSASGER